MASDEGKKNTQAPAPLRIVGQPPTPFDIITRAGVVDALWDILEEANDRTDPDTEGSKS